MELVASGHGPASSPSPVFVGYGVFAAALTVVLVAIVMQGGAGNAAGREFASRGRGLSGGVPLGLTAGGHHCPPRRNWRRSGKGGTTALCSECRRPSRPPTRARVRTAVRGVSFCAPPDQPLPSPRSRKLRAHSGTSARAASALLGRGSRVVGDRTCPSSSDPQLHRCHRSKRRRPVGPEMNPRELPRLGWNLL